MVKLKNVVTVGPFTLRKIAKLPADWLRVEAAKLQAQGRAVAIQLWGSRHILVEFLPLPGGQVILDEF